MVTQTKGTQDVKPVFVMLHAFSESPINGEVLFVNAQDIIAVLPAMTANQKPYTRVAIRTGNEHQTVYTVTETPAGVMNAMNEAIQIVDGN